MIIIICILNLYLTQKQVRAMRTQIQQEMRQILLQLAQRNAALQEDLDQQDQRLFRNLHQGIIYRNNRWIMQCPIVSQIIQKNLIELIIDLIFLCCSIYIINTSYITWPFFIIWMIIHFIQLIKEYVCVALLLYSIYAYIFYKPTLEIIIFLYLYTFYAMCMFVKNYFKISKLQLCFLPIWESYPYFKKYIRYRKNINKIREICAIKFNQISGGEQNNVVCSICLEKQGNFCKTCCNHYFHPTCLQKSLKKNKKCPVCRRVLY